MDIHPGIKPDPGFPTREVERCIRDTLADQAGVQVLLRSQPKSACEPAIDSLVVVEIICAIEEAIGVNLPTAFVPRGGYRDVEECVADVMSEARSVWPDLAKEEVHHE